MVTIGNKIKKLRQSRGMTQEALGELLGVNKSTIQKYESGSVNLSADKIKILCKTFKAFPRYFVYEDNEEYVRDLFGRNYYGRPDFLDDDRIAVWLFEKYLEIDVLDILYPVIRMNSEGRRKVTEFARLVSEFYPNPLDKKDE